MFAWFQRYLFEIFLFQQTRFWHVLPFPAPTVTRGARWFFTAFIRKAFTIVRNGTETLSLYLWEITRLCDAYISLQWWRNWRRSEDLQFLRAIYSIGLLWSRMFYKVLRVFGCKLFHDVVYARRSCCPLLMSEEKAPHQTCMHADRYIPIRSSAQH